jgi:hypothetical protein
MPKYTAWTWSAAHGRHYCYFLADDGCTILETLWSGPPGPGDSAAQAHPTPQVPDDGYVYRWSRLIRCSSNGSVTDNARRGHEQRRLHVAPPTTLHSNVQEQDEEHEHREDDGIDSGNYGDERDGNNENYGDEHAGSNETSSRDVDTIATQFGNMAVGHSSQQGKGKARSDSVLKPQHAEMQRQGIAPSGPSHPYPAAIPAAYRTNAYNHSSTPQYGYVQPATFPPPSPAYNYNVNAQGTPAYTYNQSNAQNIQNTQAIQAPWAPPNRSTLGSLPRDIQQHLGYKDRRFIRTEPDPNNAEKLDARKYTTMISVSPINPSKVTEE